MIRKIGGGEVNWRGHAEKGESYGVGDDALLAGKSVCGAMSNFRPQAPDRPPNLGR